MNELDTRFCRNIVHVYRRQMNLLAKLDNREWSFDLNSASLRIGGSEKWAVQVLSMETSDGSWTWAWADDSFLPAHCKTAAQQLQKIGRTKKIEAFATAKLLTSVFCCGGHTPAVAAAAQFSGVPYFVAMSGAHRFYLLVTELEFRKELPPPTLHDLVTLLPQLFSDYTIPDHRLAIISGLRKYSLPFQDSKRGVTVRDKGKSYRFTFDSHGRLSSVESE